MLVLLSIFTVYAIRVHCTDKDPDAPSESLWTNCLNVERKSSTNSGRGAMLTPPKKRPNRAFKRSPEDSYFSQPPQIPQSRPLSQLQSLVSAQTQTGRTPKLEQSPKLKGRSMRASSIHPPDGASPLSRPSRAAAKSISSTTSSDNVIANPFKQSFATSSFVSDKRDSYVNVDMGSSDPQSINLSIIGPLRSGSNTPPTPVNENNTPPTQPLPAPGITVSATYDSRQDTEAQIEAQTEAQTEAQQETKQNKLCRSNTKKLFAAFGCVSAVFGCWELLWNCDLYRKGDSKQSPMGNCFDENHSSIININNYYGAQYDPRYIEWLNSINHSHHVNDTPDDDNN